MRRRAGRATAAAVVLAVGATVAACGGGNASLRSRVDQWESANAFGQTVGTLLGDSARVRAVVQRGQGPAALRTVCGVLEGDASTAGGTLPTPVVQLTTDLDRAYRDDVAGASLCYGAGDPATVSRALSAITRADALLEQAVQLVAGVTGTVPVTTTTTTPGGGAGGDPFGF